MTDAKDGYVPVGELYGMCLHTGLLRAMASFQGDGRRRHELPVFKENLPRWLRQDRGKLIPIIVGDPAYIDILYWWEQRHRRQATIITREKKNMKPTVISHYQFDANDAVNRGVEADQMAGYAYAYLRRIVYRDPATGERFVFVTTDTTLRPGVIALLYALRWKIEKAYDVFKTSCTRTRRGRRAARQPTPKRISSRSRTTYSRSSCATSNQPASRKRRRLPAPMSCGSKLRPPSKHPVGKWSATPTS